VETCRLLPSEALAEALEKVFGTDGHFQRVQALVEETSVIPMFRDFVKVERTADEMRVYEPYQIPALLQTEDYIRAAGRAWRPMRSDEEIEKAVALRLTRQEIFDGDDALPPVNYTMTPRFWFIIDESVLRRKVGNVGVMRAQLEHLTIFNGGG
jgi:hypothetical protein